MDSCQKRYHNAYQQQKKEFDAKVIEWIDTKEEIVATSPNTNAFLKHEFSRMKIRRYKTGGICWKTELYSYSLNKTTINS